MYAIAIYNIETETITMYTATDGKIVRFSKSCAQAFAADINRHHFSERASVVCIE